MKKKILLTSVMFVFLILCSSIFTRNEVQAAYANDENGFQWYYELSDDNAVNVRLNNGTVSGNTLTVPTTLDGHTVISIGAPSSSSYGIFYSYSAYSNNRYRLTKLVVPDGIKTIGCVFYNSSYITTVEMADSVETIGQYAFYNCSYLNSVQFSNNLKTIGDRAFYQNSNLRALDLPDSVETIGQYAFYRIGLSGTLELPDNLTEIGHYAFQNCSSITSIDFNENLKKIGNYCFKGTALSGSLTFATNLEEIGDYAFQSCSNLTEVNFNSNLKKIGNSAFYNTGLSGTLILPAELEEIGNYAFEYCYYITGISFNEKLKKIGTGAFYYDTGLTEALNFPASLERIEDYAFYYCSSISGISFSEGLKAIGNYAFYGNYNLQGSLIFPSTIESIGNDAFYNCSYLTGDLNLPDSLTYLGSEAFRNCRGFTGVLTTGSGLKDILGYTFYGTKFSRINLGEVTSLGYYSFYSDYDYSYSDIWIDNEEENVTLNSSGVTGENMYPYIHYRNCTHKVEIATVAGVKVINQTTGEVMTSGNYPCETAFNFKLEIEDGYNYQNLQLIIIDDNDVVHYKSYDGNDVDVYEFSTLLRDRKVFVQNLSMEPDFALRAFVTEVNRNLVSRSRVPVFKMEDGEFKYLHTKSPQSVKTGDLVTFKIRVYNESSRQCAPGKIAVHIPDGLEYVAENRTNVNAGWVVQDGLAVSSKYENTNIAGNVGNGVAKFKDIEIVLKVTLDKTDNTDTFRTLFAEIYQNSNDTDSTAGNISIPSYTDYRTEELFETDNNSYVTCGEDDEDFDTIYLRGKIKVDYNIVINKIDGDTKQVLDGAKFNLLDKDGNVIATVESDQDGIVDFGGLSTYGSGTDIYYIQEIQTPDGYYLTDNKKIRVKVEKTILNEDNGLYSLKVSCDTLAYTIDTTRYDFTPIYTIDQFKKIGSGEMVEIDGVKYQYNIDTNYKLMADLDFSANGVDPRWTPIDHEMKCIIDGDGHKIKGLVIAGDNLDYSEVGIFSVFSGIVQNLEIENMTISFNGFTNEPFNISGKTGVGCFAGVMRDGYIINCKSSGVIATGVDNVGGFVGHTLENGIVRVDGCTNNTELHGHFVSDPYNWDPSGNSNAGGIIGCALGSVSVNNSVNNGQITTFKYNAGGLVGYVDPSEYEDISINTAYDEDNKILNLLVENITTEADYTVHLQDIDIDTEEALLGGVYTVYDGAKNVLDGMEKMELDEIMKKIVERQLRAVGLDTYYIIEDAPVPGYEPINGIVQLDVERYWDDNALCYRFRIQASIISDIRYEIAEPRVRLERPVFDRGDIFTDVQIEKANMNTEKAEFIGCTNNGEIVGCYMNNAGIVATSHGYTYIENCKNQGHINMSNYGKAGGMIAELYAFKEDCVIKGCENTGAIEAGTGTSSAGGMAGCVVADLTVSNCKNSGTIKNTGSGGAAGILADARGFLTIESCENSGYISSLGTPDNGPNYVSVNCIAAGIIAKNCYEFQSNSFYVSSRDDSTLTMRDCVNTGDIYSSCHTGGMIAFSDGLWLDVQDCEIKDCYIHDIGGDKGGVVGFLQVPNVSIKNCSMDNVDLVRTSDIINNTYGCTGAMIGNWTNTGWHGVTLENLEVINCSATNSNISTFSQNVGGMVGIHLDFSSTSTSTITDCYVGNCNVINDKEVSTYGGVGGILGNTYGAKLININNCCVENSNVISRVQDPEYYSGTIDAGGIFGMGQGLQAIEVTGCDVIDSHVECKAGRAVYVYPDYTYYSGEGCATAGGIISEVGTGIDHCYIDECKVINTDVITNAGTVGGIIAHCGVTSGRYSDYEDFHGRITNCTFDGGEIINTALSTSASITAGVAGYCSGRTYFENCNVNEAQIKGLIDNENAGTNTVGICGMISGNVKLLDCTLTNSDLYCTGAYGSGEYANANISGMVGYSDSIIDLENCNVDKCTFSGPRPANVAGLTGSQSSSQLHVNNCSVKNSTMENGTEGASRSTNCTVAGLVAQCNYGYIRNSIVDNCTIKGKALVTGGAVGTICGYDEDFELENVSVENTDIIDEGIRPVNRTIGGVVGSSKNGLSLNNINVYNVDIISKAMNIGGAVGFVLDDSTLDNVSVGALTINNTSEMGGANGAMGGLIGIAADSNNNDEKIINIAINDCIVRDSSITDTFSEGVNGNIYMGGIVGFSENTTIEDSTVIATSMTNPSYGFCGGLVGMIYRYGQYKGTLDVSNSRYTSGAITSNSFSGGIAGMSNNTTLDNVNVASVDIVNNNSFGMSGGMVGIIPDTSDALNVSNSTVLSTNVTATAHTGGMLGIGKINATDNLVMNVTVSIPNDNPGAIIGGVVGIAQSGSVIDGLTARDITVNPKSCSAGGIAGKYEGTMSDVDVYTVDVLLNSGWGEIGGVVGIQGGNLSDITVGNANVKGLKNGGSYGDVGAVAGVVMYGDITGAKVTNSTILSNKNAGGIAGVLGGNLKNSSCDRVSVTVEGAGKNDSGSWEGGDCGGAVGACARTIQNVSVTNSTIKNPHKLTGGIVGAGYADTSELIDLTVDGNTIIYNDQIEEQQTDGTYIGAPDLEVTFTNPQAGGDMLEVILPEDKEEIEKVEEDTKQNEKETLEPKDSKKEKEEEEIKDTTSDPKDDEIEASDEPDCEEINGSEEIETSDEPDCEEIETSDEPKEEKDEDNKLIEEKNDSNEIETTEVIKEEVDSIESEITSSDETKNDTKDLLDEENKQEEIVKSSEEPSVVSETIASEEDSQDVIVEDESTKENE